MSDEKISEEAQYFTKALLAAIESCKEEGL